MKVYCPQITENEYYLLLFSIYIKNILLKKCPNGSYLCLSNYEYLIQMKISIYIKILTLVNM